ncbi:hypothetical protein VM1G_07228 [Cytospora mali]|uniref:Uncharacterized protein n=1 Tax=Cytospora mali TaxID=578113 RepID=A0A194W3B8_CYTMA|nr:hypothetical protein VM1G_07228 [Valsa mali]
MRASSILTASASLLSLAQARIIGIGVPSTIKPGDTFDLIIGTEGYIQPVTDVAVAVGYTAGPGPFGDSLGTFITAFDLVDESNDPTNYTKSVTLPATAEAGASNFTASLTSLYGVYSAPSLIPFSVSFTIGNETSTTYVYGGL